VPVLRSGRYTLIELTPAQDQRDLMHQVVNVTIPATPGSTVADGVRYVLLQTGYQLCSLEDSTQALERLPLPAAHIHLGPMTLRDALTVLGSDAGELHVNPTLREVCFETPPANSDAITSSGVRP
jgi:type IV pili sensor histidine kinase/response regulator